MTDVSRKNISAIDHHPRKSLSLSEAEMSYVEVGEGDPIVFLHGNPTSSYLWRNIIPYAADLGRCLAPDLIGMGKSTPSPSYSYGFVDHARYLDEWFQLANVGGSVILVIHDWGSALGFHYAKRHPEKIAGIVYMEGLVKPRSWKAFGAIEDQFRTLRSPKGEDICLGDDAFVEKMIPELVVRKLSEEEMAVYRAPYPTRESRIPTLVWAREIPIEEERKPAEVYRLVEEYGAFMGQSTFPKLLIKSTGGTILFEGGDELALARTYKSQREVTVEGKHFLQEDSPDEIGQAMREFIKEVRAERRTS